MHCVTAASLERSGTGMCAEKGVAEACARWCFGSVKVTVKRKTHAEKRQSQRGRLAGPLGSERPIIN